MTIDKDHKAQQIRLVGGVQDTYFYNWTGEGSFVLRETPDVSTADLSVSMINSPQEAVQSARFTDYTLRFITSNGKRIPFAAPREWPDDKALQHLLGAEC